jgi:Domain of unknown function DUF1828
MNCQSLLPNIGFECMSLDSETLRIWSPFSYGIDGEHIGVYVEKRGNRVHVTDNAEALMHASSMGIKITDRRIDAVRRAASDVTISRGGIISTTVDDTQMHEGVLAVLNAALAVGHFETAWAPRVRAESFAKMVGDILATELGERLLRDVHVIAASGHQLELPFAIQGKAELIYLQPVAAEDDKVNWTNVYSGFGKMTDLKNAGAESGTRVVVLEDAPGDPEMPKAVSLLAMSATVVQFPRLRQWVQRHAA